MKNIFLLISAILPLISPIVYSKAILKGTAKPHRTTTFVLLLITTISTVSLFAQHDHVAIWLAGVSALQSIIIFVLSVKRGMGGWAKIDLGCLTIAIIGIITWQITKAPILALYFSIAADFVGVVPSFIKTYQLPKTEIWSYYLLDTLAGGFNLLALRSWTVQEYSYPLYILLINFAMVLLIIRPKYTK